ncbi:MAG: hypothetical protein E7527_04750 [Ruminococcaceae bacterium]|nr:hypothetical protein [Oscillospiraceae bacterium]
MKGKSKRIAAALLCLCLLAGTTACGEEKPEKSAYQQGMEALEKKDYVTAYKQLKESKDRRAAQVLEKFRFVPVKYTSKQSNGRDNATTYTYDENGNLVREERIGTDGSRLVECTYSGNKLITRKTQQRAGDTTTQVYVYDAKGNLTMVRYLNRNGDWLGQTIYTYDEQGRCLSEEKAMMEEASELTPQLNYTRYHTYDSEGRVLTQTDTYYYEGEIEEKSTLYYTYEEDGSYCEVWISEVAYHNDPKLTQTTYYDAKGKELRGESQYEDETEPYYVFEYRYNDRGDVEYDHHRYFAEEEVTLYTYDEAGNLLEQETTTLEGEQTYFACNTYDERGNRLTHELADVKANFWCKIVCTYDAENRLLTQKRDDKNGWESTTNTYNDQGQLEKEEMEGEHSSHTKTFTYDPWGNVIASFQYHVNDGSEVASEQATQWELRYYPEGVPEDVQAAMDRATITGS